MPLLLLLLPPPPPPLLPLLLLKTDVDVNGALITVICDLKIIYR
jgi:hypothetical protein